MYGIVANVLTDSFLRDGAKVWILLCYGDAENPLVTGLGKKSKKVIKHIPYKRLTNFRAKWIPDTMAEQVEMKWESKDSADEFANSLNVMWSNIRYFNRDGTVMLRDGEKASAAFDKVRSDDP